MTKRNASAIVRGQRVLLRYPTRRDQEEFIAMNIASKRLHRGWVSPPTTPDEFAALLKRCRRAESVYFLICRVTDGAIVGTVNLSQIFMGGFRSAYMGYYLGAKYTGQGYMTEAVRLMLRYAFERLKLHRVEANIQPENAASLAVVRRVRFVREGYSRRYLKISGRWRDHERWTMLAEDWKRQKQGGRMRDEG